MDLKDSLQMTLYPDLKEAEPPKVRGRRGRIKGWTTLRIERCKHVGNQLHLIEFTPQCCSRHLAALTLYERFQSEQERGPDFLRLANALSALYPKDAEEKRLLDAMLLAVPR